MCLVSTQFMKSGVESRNSESTLLFCVYYSSTLQGRILQYCILVNDTAIFILNFTILLSILQFIDKKNNS